jgi:hypothetical protein
MGHFLDLCKNSPVFSNSNLRQGLFRSCVSLARFPEIKKRKRLRKDQLTPYLSVEPVQPMPMNQPVQTQIENPSTRHDTAQGEAQVWAGAGAGAWPQGEGGAAQGEAQVRAGAGAGARGAGRGAGAG